MKSKLWVSAIVAGTMALGVASAAHADANLLQNGSFETGSLSPFWTLTGNTTFNSGAVTSFGSVAPQDGHYMWSDGAITNPAILSQTFNDVAGANYTVTGWFNCSSGCTTGSLEGSGVVAGANPAATPFTAFQNVATAGVGGWQQATFNFTGTGQDTLSLFIRNDPSWSQADNFSVYGPTPVPGPIPGAGLLSFVVLGLAGAATRFRGYLSV